MTHTVVHRHPVDMRGAVERRDLATSTTTSVKQRRGLANRFIGDPIVHEKEVAGHAHVRTIESAPLTCEAIRDVIVGPTVYLIEAYGDELSNPEGNDPYVIVQYGTPDEVTKGIAQVQETPVKRFAGGICKIHDFLSFSWREGASLKLWMCDKRVANEHTASHNLVPENFEACPRGTGDHRSLASMLPSLPFPPHDTWLGDVDMFDEAGNSRGVISAAIFIGQEVMGRIFMANPHVDPENPFGTNPSTTGLHPVASGSQAAAPGPQVPPVQQAPQVPQTLLAGSGSAAHTVLGSTPFSASHPGVGPAWPAQGAALRA